MNEFMENKERALVVFLVLMIVIVVVIAIILMVVIWSPKEEKIEEVTITTPGVFENVKITEEELVVAYFAEIYSNMFTSADYVYNQLDEEYIAYKNFTKENFVDFLEDKSLIGNRLTLSRYKKYKLDDNIMIYNIYFTNIATGLQDSLIIKETSPNNYKIAFEDFLSYKTNLDPIVSSGIELDIKEILIEESQIKIDMNIINLEYSQIELNSNNEYNPIKLISDDSYYPLITDSIRNESLKIVKNSQSEYFGYFRVDDNNYDINKINISNILYENLNKNEGITFDI